MFLRGVLCVSLREKCRESETCFAQAAKSRKDAKVQKTKKLLDNVVELIAMSDVIGSSKKVLAKFCKACFQVHSC